MSWADSVVLLPNEKVVNSWKGIWITNERTLPERNAKPKEREVLRDRKKGYLVLTSHRILFLDEEQTMVSVSLKKFVETWMEKTPTEVDCPCNNDAYVFRLSDVNRKEFKDFRELVIYYSQKVDDAEREGEKQVSMKVG